MATSGYIVGIGVVLIASGLAFLLPAAFLSVNGYPVALLLGLIAVLLALRAWTEYSSHVAASEKFFRYCDQELKDL